MTNTYPTESQIEHAQIDLDADIEAVSALSILAGQIGPAIETAIQQASRHQTASGLDNALVLATDLSDEIAGLLGALRRVEESDLEIEICDEINAARAESRRAVA